jgi:hypothetical protein
VVAWTSRGDDYEGDVRARVVAAAGVPITGASTLIAGDFDVPERMASVARHGDGYVVLWHRLSNVGSVVQDVGLVAIDTVLAPEAAPVQAMLSAAGNQQTGSVAATDETLWIAWSDDAIVPGVPRAFVAFVLAVE